MSADDVVMSRSDDLATSRRTVAGVLRLFNLLDIPPDAAAATFAEVGLPSHALIEADFPIVLTTELAAYLAALRHGAADRSEITTLFARASMFGLESLGVMGMAMRYAPTVSEGYRILLTSPGLSWGHSRITMRRTPNHLVMRYEMAPPAIAGASADELHRLARFCVVMDLLSSLRNIEDMTGGRVPPVAVHLPLEEPHDWSSVAADLPYRVTFSAAEASATYPASLSATPLETANPLAHQMFKNATRRLSRDFVEDLTLSDRVSRTLWAYGGPASRADVARALHLSERTLTRRLAAEGTSFARLLAAVQSERARNYLAAGALSIAEIAARMGYSEPAAFSRAFKSWTGTSPSAWRAAPGVRHG